MSTVKITQLPSITGANADAADVLPLVDVSGNITSKITRQEFFDNIPAASVVGDLTIGDKIVHSGDTNTAIRFPAADTVTVETNGVERVRVDSSGNVGVGTTSPSVPLTLGPSTLPAGLSIQGLLVTAESGANSLITARLSAATGSPVINQITSSGTASAPTAVASGRALGRNNWFGFDGTNYVNAVAITAQVDGTPGTGSMPGRLMFLTTPSGSGTPVERLRIDSNGNVGIATSAPIVTLHVTGATVTTGVVYKNQPAQTSKAAAATLTIAELLTGIIQYTGGAANLTLPTGTSIEGGVPATFPTDMSFDFSVINTGSGTATVVTNTGLTLVGAMTVAAGSSGRFRVRKTATNTYTVYRIS